MDEELRELTVAEAAAVAALRRLAKKWPSTLMLASMDGSLCVLPNDDSRLNPLDRTALDPDAVFETVTGIPNTGGAW